MLFSVCACVVGGGVLPGRVGVCMYVRACNFACPACNGAVKTRTRWFKYDRD